MCVYVCVCVLLTLKSGGGCFEVFPVIQTFDIATQSFDTRNTFYV